MKILIVDDSPDCSLLAKTFLKKAGYNDIITAQSAKECFELLGMDGPESEPNNTNIDIILMDIVMADVDGLEAVRKIKATASVKDIPIVMVTANTDDNNLQTSFEIGAIDYVTKPVNKIELRSRVRSILKLKEETDRRMKLMRELEEANRKLERLTFIDGLTAIANRRHFDKSLDKEMRNARRENKVLSLIMMDIDFFKKYNDSHGHQEGDDCLKQVAKVLDNVAHRPGDLAARYGGEEFAIVLPDADSENAVKIAEKARAAVADLKIPHGNSTVLDYVTLSLGVATVKPICDKAIPQDLIHAADKALYLAKENGRNRSQTSEDL